MGQREYTKACGCSIDQLDISATSWGVPWARRILPNSDTCSRNKIHALQVVEACTIGHQGDTKASGVFQWPVGYYRDQLAIPTSVNPLGVPIRPIYFYRCIPLIGLVLWIFPKAGTFASAMPGDSPGHNCTVLGILWGTIV